MDHDVPQLEQDLLPPAKREWSGGRNLSPQFPWTKDREVLDRERYRVALPVLTQHTEHTVANVFRPKIQKQAGQR